MVRRKLALLICFLLVLAISILQRPARSESGAPDRSGRSTLAAPRTGEFDWQTALPHGIYNGLEDREDEEVRFPIRPGNTNYGSPKTPGAELQPGARDASGRSSLHSPVTGRLNWQNSLPLGISNLLHDREDEEQRFPARPQNETYLPPRTKPAKLAPQEDHGEGDPPVAFQNIKVTSNNCGSVLEPVASNHGDVIFYTGNCIGGAASTDGGKNWSYTGFNAAAKQWQDLNGDIQCGCDQDVLYSPQINKFIWYRQGGGNDWTKGQQEPNSITLIDGDDPVKGKACSFTVYPSTVNSNWGASYWFDFPAIALGVNDVYLTANLVNNASGGSNEGAVIVRFDLASLNNACSSGGSTNLDWYEVDTNSAGFGIGMAYGSPDLFGLGTMMFAAHLQNDQLRVYSWPEAADHTGVTSVDISHSPYRPPSNEQCKTPDGGNPCNSLQPWYISGWVDQIAGTVSFVWNAGAVDAAQFPFPYLDVVTINAPPGHIHLISEGEIWSSDFAFLVGAGGTDIRGRPALTAFIAGGVDVANARYVFAE
jgi:hypothetical protein